MIACVFVLHLLYLNCVAEDAFIALRYARNLARGDGLVWNPGAPPVEGYTDFLWVLLSAAAIKLGASGVIFAQVMSIAAGAASLVLTLWIGRTLLGWSPRVALVPVGLLALCGPFVTWSSSAMESTLFTFLVLLATCLVALFWRSARASMLAAAVVVLLLATLTRPEGLMIAALLLGLSGVVSLLDDRPAVAPVILAGAAYALLVAAYVAWRYSRYGYLLPNTFYAKTGGGLPQVLRGGLLAYLFLMQFALPLVPAGLMAIWAAGLPRVGRLSRGDLADAFRAHAFLIFAAVIVVAYTAYNVLVGGDYMAMHRFFVPVLPFLYLLFGAVTALLHSRATTRANAAGLGALLAFTAAATVFPSTPLERSFFASPPQQHGDYRGVQIERWHVARLSVIGAFFDGYRHGAGDSLATSAIGAIGYYANLQVYDIHGLVDTYIAHLPAPPDFAAHRPGHGREDLPYTLSLRPTYVMFSRDLTPAPIELWRYVPQELRAAVERDYVHQAVWLVDRRNGEQGYFTFFERRDSAASRTATGHRA